jgi:hypothetical protein
VAIGSGPVVKKTRRNTTLHRLRILCLNNISFSSYRQPNLARDYSFFEVSSGATINKENLIKLLEAGF